MAALTEEQRSFLEKHEISIGDVFDAAGLKRSEYNAVMTEIGKNFAYNVTPCKKFGHSLRTRNGTCIQCQPAAIAFQIRDKATAYLYIAGSKKLSVIKVGVCSSVEKRQSSLNRLGYEGTQDWEVLALVKMDNAGSTEFAIHRELKDFEFPTHYKREGSVVECIETFRCAFSTVFAVFREYAQRDGSSEIWLNATANVAYEFESQSGLSFNRSRRTSEKHLDREPRRSSDVIATDSKSTSVDLESVKILKTSKT